jgi:hypothetical protein
MLDGADDETGERNSVAVLRDGTMLGGGRYSYYFGTYTCANAGGEVKRHIRSTRRCPLRCRLREGWSLLDLAVRIPTKVPKLKTRDSLASEAVDSNQRSGC